MRWVLRECSIFAAIVFVSSVVLIVPCAGLVRCGGMQLHARSAAIDETHASPNGTKRVRILITDAGALGYGAIYVYEQTRIGGRLLFSHGPAVAEPDPERVRWISENEFELHYVDPHARDSSDKRVVLKL